jgi:hypothetical protein
MAAGQVYIATETGVTAPINGVEYAFQKGVTRVRAGHPLLTACPNYFEPDVSSVTYDVEQATAAPGERRGDK